MLRDCCLNPPRRRCRPYSFPVVRANLRLPATFPHSASILAIYFDQPLSTTTRTTTKDEDDLEPEVHHSLVGRSFV
jgi:hypothetical protein